MRVFKSNTSGLTQYPYDGQMGIQGSEANGTGAWQKTTDYAVGARGEDGILTMTSSGTTLSCPLYDAHGNKISTLARNCTGYTYSATRGFDAWGVIRVGGQTGDPKGRYCANLGHKQDDESGLVYMRARYYEPTSGRFVSEDEAKHGRDWFIYASNRPVNRVDPTGKEDLVENTGSMSLGAFLSGLGSQISAICLNATSRIGQVVNIGTPLAALLKELDENPGDWNYVEEKFISDSGVTGMMKAFVKMDADPVVMKWLISSEDEADNVIPHATPYFDPTGAPKGGGTGLNPFE